MLLLPRLLFSGVPVPVGVGMVVVALQVRHKAGQYACSSAFPAQSIAMCRAVHVGGSRSPLQKVVLVLVLVCGPACTVVLPTGTGVVCPTGPAPAVVLPADARVVCVGVARSSPGVSVGAVATGVVVRLLRVR